MKPLVLLIGDGETARGLEAALAQAGCRVETAPDGFYATLALERKNPVAVVVPYELDDMPAAELGAILAEDPNLADVRRVLIGVPPDVHGGATGDELRRAFDLVISSAVSPSRLADGVCSFILPRRNEATGGLRGNLDAVDFPELVQLLAGSGDAGVLLLKLPDETRLGVDGRARLYFDRGKIVHCTFGEESGERAFDSVLDVALAGRAEFRYQRLSREEIFKLPRSLHGRADQVLLSAAARRDARQWEAGAESGRGRCSSA